MIRRRICRHCGGTGTPRPRGLCWTCYYTPGVRDLYPSTSIFARRGVLDCGRELPVPTLAPPGSAEKIHVLECRAARGELLHHPRDARSW